MADEMRDELAAALPDSLGEVQFKRRAIPPIGQRESITGYGDRLLDALLPTVQRIVAEAVAGELRAAADGIYLDESERYEDRARIVAWLHKRADKRTAS